MMRVHPLLLPNEHLPMTVEVDLAVALGPGVLIDWQPQHPNIRHRRWGMSIMFPPSVQRTDTGQFTLWRR